jgi:hypothetical protein
LASVLNAADVQYRLQSVLREDSTGKLVRPHPLAHATLYNAETVPDPKLAVWGIGGAQFPFPEADALSVIASVQVSTGSEPASGIWEVPADKVSRRNSLSYSGLTLG